MNNKTDFEIARQNKMDKNNEYIIGKIYIKSCFKIETPLIIGSGETENTDIDIVKDIDEGGKYQPVIPASSLIGVFRHIFDPVFMDANQESNENKVNKFYNQFFGDNRDSEKKKQDSNRENELSQSAFVVHDVILSDKIGLRDGVDIDMKFNTAKEHSKYNYELIEPGGTFDLIFEITLRPGHKLNKEDYPKTAKEYFKTFVGIFIEQIENGRIRFGAKTNKGFGVLKLNDEMKNIEIWETNLQTSKDVYAWIMNKPQYEKKHYQEILHHPLDLHQKYFNINAELFIKNSMLIKSYPRDTNEPDAVPIKSNGKYVLPGTSIMGAIRHRAWKIMNTMNIEKKEKRFYDLFGYVKAPDLYPEYEKLENSAQKGRVIVDETFIENPLKSIIDEIQTRIKIDRFTGGTIAGALFEEKVLWQKDDETTIKINIKIKDYEDWEAGLMLFVLKDLTTGYLPIGGGKNVGRGFLIGKNANIKWIDGDKEASAELIFDENGFVKSRDELKKLDQFIEEWNKYHGEEVKNDN